MPLPFSLPFAVPPSYRTFSSLQASHAWGLAQQDPPLSVRASYEQEALQRYKGAYYKAINALLRGDKLLLKQEQRQRKGCSTARLGQDIRDIEEAVAVAEIDCAVVAWRAFHGEVQALYLLQNIGGDFEDKGFVSCSLDPAFAWGLLDLAKPWPVLLTLLLPKGSAALYLENIYGVTSAVREQELLLLSGSVFTILKAQLDPQTGVTHALLQF